LFALIHLIYWWEWFCLPGAVYNEKLMIQGHHFSLLQHETEKLRNDIEKMRSELRYIHRFEQILTNHHSCAHLICYEFYSAIVWFVIQVWDGQSHCWTAIGFEPWKGVSEEQMCCLSKITELIEILVFTAMVDILLHLQEN
jgi:hypothetical protein